MEQCTYLRNTEPGRFEVFGDLLILLPLFTHLEHDRIEAVPVPARCRLFFGVARLLFRFIGGGFVILKSFEQGSRQQRPILLLFGYEGDGFMDRYENLL